MVLNRSKLAMVYIGTKLNETVTIQIYDQARSLRYNIDACADNQMIIRDRPTLLEISSHETA